MLRALTIGNLKLFLFWITNVFTLFNQLPSELTNKDALARQMNNQQNSMLMSQNHL